MSKVAIALMTKDRCELTKRTIEPLLDSDRFDLWLIDGSDTEAGRKLAESYPVKHLRTNVRGGADPAIAYALTELLAHDYDYVGICESDVLLPHGFFGSMFALFERGRADGLEVGVVSARAYVDRILCQRDGYALMLNTGFGQQLYTRAAAQIALKHLRTVWTIENRRVFAKLTGWTLALGGPFVRTSTGLRRITAWMRFWLRMALRRWHSRRAQYRWLARSRASRSKA
jgi:hypothetical protein